MKKLLAAFLFSTMACATSFQWDPDFNADYYNFYYGPKDGDFYPPLRVEGTTFQLPVILSPSIFYKFAVTSVNDLGESAKSEILMDGVKDLEMIDGLPAATAVWIGNRPGAVLQSSTDLVTWKDELTLPVGETKFTSQSTPIFYRIIWRPRNRPPRPQRPPGPNQGG